MATRAEIRDAFYDMLLSVSGSYDVTADDGTVVDTVSLDAADIGLREREGQVSLPSIVYHENYRPVTYNGVGTGPDMKTYRDDGSVADERWRSYIEAQFIIDVRASSEGVKEPIYEALRKRFERYQHDPWPASDIHPHVLAVDVSDSTSVDEGSVEETVRGDQIEVRVTFYREYVYDVENIESVSQSVDAGSDGTIDDNYETN